MKDINYKKNFLLLAILSVIAVGIYALFSRVMHKTYFDFLVWNLFLAWIPFLMSIFIYELHQRTKSKIFFFTIPVGIVWLLFFPNSAYIITDLIHLTLAKSAYMVSGRVSLGYWYDFLIILLFAWIGLVLGFISTYQIHFLLHRKVGKIISWLFIAATSLLGGYGILLGRIYRLNSWDIIYNVPTLLSVIQQTINLRALLFCILFGVVIAFVYLTLYMLINNDSSQKNRSIR